MTHDDHVDTRERISRMEAIAYIESLLPELITLAVSEPRLQELLRSAHQEARHAVAGYDANPLWSGAAPSDRGAG